MTLTAQQAIEMLPGITTKEELRILINQLDITATGTTTILYSGETASGVQTNDIIQAMLRNGEDIRVIGTTEAAKFLFVGPNDPTYNEAFVRKLEQLLGDNPEKPGSKSYQFMYGEQAADGTRIPNGVWDNASARFVDATEGEIRTLTAGANVNRTFFQTELSHALRNSKISSIDGIPIAYLQKMGNANAFKAISAQSDVYSSQLIVAVKSDGEFIRTIDEYLLLDSRGFFKATGLEGKPPLLEMVRSKNLAEFMPNRITQHDQGRIMLNDIAKYYREQSRLLGAENVTLRMSALRVLDKLGWAGDLLALVMMAGAANAAYASGDNAGGDKLVRDWAGDFAGGLAGGWLAANIVGSALAPLYLTGPAGALVAGGLMLLAGFAGGILGSLGFGTLLDTFSKETGSAGLAGATPPRRDPLVLDLDGDGIETTSTSDGPVLLFDHDGDGVKTGTGWVKPDDGWLVLDLNGNGTIDSGRELFGVDTLKCSGQLAKDGFDAIKDLDDNKDGKIDSADSVFANLRIWRDLNQDGISQVGELTTLRDNGITSIGVNSTAVQVNLGNGNSQTAVGTFILSNGTADTTSEAKGVTANLELLVNTFYRQFINHITLSDQAKAMPNLRGSGRVRDLSEAISLSTDLGNWVQIYTQQTTRQGQIEMLDGFIEKWANTADFISLKSQADALASSGVKLTYNLAGLTNDTFAYDNFLHKLGVVERFMGFTYGGTNGQARFTLLDSISANITVLLATEQIASISLAYENLKKDIYESLFLQTRLSSYFDGLGFVMVDGQVVLDSKSLESAFGQAIAVNSRDGIIDLVEFLGTAGDTRLGNLSWNATDFLIYQLNSAADLGPFSEALRNLTVHFASSTEHNITGTSRPDLLVGTAGGDYLYGRDNNDTLIGGGGGDYLQCDDGNDIASGGNSNDILYGGNGNDNLQGNEHNDTLCGDAGNDTLDGGSGDDYLSGGSGADVYLFGRGAGQDIIYNYDGDAVGTNLDTILLAGSINAMGLRLTRQADDLVISLDDSHDRLCVQHYFSNDSATNYVVENLEFSDGTIWDVATIKSKVLIGNVGSDMLIGYASADTLSGGDGKDWLYGNAGNDLLSGGNGGDYLQCYDGNDTASGGSSNDILYGGNGDDNLQGNDHNDTLFGEAGNDTLDGGSGDDYLSGGSGADVYLFGKGSGQDIIYNYDDHAFGTNLDTILLAANINAMSLRLTRHADDLVISLNDSRDRLCVQHYFSNDGALSYAVENLKFADGTIWNIATIKSKVLIGNVADDVLFGYASADTLSGGDGKDWLYGNAGNDLINGGNGGDYLKCDDGNDTACGGSSNDILYGGNGDDNLQGNEHNDTLFGDAGNDTLDGGSGDDYLSGGSGADVYLFGKGSGQDIIYNYDDHAFGTNLDTILLAANINAMSLRLTRHADDLVISLNDSRDRLCVQHYFSNDGALSYAVENLKFADGTIWNIATIKSKVLIGNVADDVLFGYASADTLSGGDGKDWLYGNAGNDLINGGNGGDYLKCDDGNDTACGGSSNDILYGGNGDDNLQGNEHNDTLFGDAGNDTLDGGSGDDYLSGGSGADVYLFGKGSGQDIIYNYDGDAVGTNLDTILLGASIAASGLRLTRQSDDLIVSLNDSRDRLCVQYYFSNDCASNYVVENLKFADGIVWNYGTVMAKLSTAIPLVSVTVNGTSASDILIGGLGDDILYGQAGNDTLDGGIGNDTLDGGAGNDTYLFGKRSGNDTISAFDTAFGKVDVIQLGNGVLARDLLLNRDGDALLLSIIGSTATLRVNSFFYNDANDGYRIEQIKFAEGTIWDINAIRLKALIGTGANDRLVGYRTADSLTGLGGDDMLYALEGSDSLEGGAGEDCLYGEDGDDLLLGGTQNDLLDGGNGNDNLQGQDGDDILYGQAGNDTLDGGLGNDTLDGGAGNDTYLFGKRSGNDTISAFDTAFGKVDVIQLGNGVLARDLLLNRDGDALLLSIIGSTATLRVNSFFYNDANDGYRIEQIKFAEGTIWDINAIRLKALIGTGANDRLVGYRTADSLTGLGGDDMLYALEGSDSLEGGAGEDCLYGEDGDDLLLGGTQNDLLDGGNGNDNLQGQDGDDLLYGQAGNDTLDGGIGNDTLDGGAGNDTYLFGKRSGNDIISAYDGVLGKVDIIQLATGVLTGNVLLNRDGDALLLSIIGSTDTLRVNSFFYNDANDGYRIERIKFFDGAIWDVNVIKLKLLIGSGANDRLIGYHTADSLTGLGGDDILHALEGSDSLDGGADEDRLYGEDGDDLLLGGTQNDQLDGGNGNDNLQGQDGDDLLYGQAGNDTLDGGIGNDTLDGGAGNDTYLFGKRSGNDIISAYDGVLGKVDIIQLATGVLTGNVLLNRDGDALLLSIIGSTDTLRVNSFFYNDANDGYRIERIKFFDGAIWDVNVIKLKLLIGSGANDRLIGYHTADSLTGLGGDDFLYAREGSDRLDGGAGEDRLYGEDGDDLVLGGTSNDQLDGGNGNDNLQGQDGDDLLYGQAGSDTLDGGIGYDTLDGGAGDDTYMFGKESNSDVITNYDWSDIEIDRVLIGKGISEEQIWLRKDGNDLQLTMIESNSKLTISSWYVSPACRVDSFTLDNGRSLLASQVDNLVSAMNAFAPPSPGHTSLPADYQAVLNPLIATNWI